MGQAKYFKPRFLAMITFGVYAALFCDIDPRLFPFGVVIMAAGVLVRLWASGYCDKATRLTTCGPYAFIRHPLYFGTLLIFLGFLVMFRAFIAGTIFLVFIAMAYRKTIEQEEKFLSLAFAPGFSNYKRRVRALLPRLTPYRGGERWSFDLKRIFFTHKEHKICVWMVVLISLFRLKHELLAGNRVGGVNLTLLCAALLFLAVMEKTVKNNVCLSRPLDRKTRL